RAEILQDQHGQRYTAPFPAHVTKAVQYGNGVKAQAVYLSQYQQIPYQRVQEQFQDQLQLPISAGSVFAFNQQAYGLLAQFEQKLIANLLATRVLHSDETGINSAGKTHWLHCVSNPQWTLYHAHAKRGVEDMIDLLLTMQQAVTAHGSALPAAQATAFHAQYRTLLQQAESECPPPEPSQVPGRRGRPKRSKSRNLLERLLNYETEALRFLTDAEVPFIYALWVPIIKARTTSA
ncbi:MAG: transposase, partial [Methylococcaceae bacterium]|nr:transposase [Methylococcaceae bacterium]